MTEKELKLLREYSSYLLTEYGFEFLPSDPVLPALYAIHRELNSSVERNKIISTAIQDALNRLNPSVYNFNAPGESWKFQIAGSLRWLFIGLSVIGLVCVCSIWWRQNHDVQHARNIIDASSPMTTKLLQQVQRDNEGYLYLQFSLSDGKSIKFYTEYEQTKANKVRVYIGKN